MLIYGRSDIAKIAFGMFGVLTYLWGMLTGYGNVNFAVAYMLFLSLYAIYIYRHNYILVILFSMLAYCNYSIVFSEYLSVIQGTLFTTYAGTDVANEAGYMLLLFWSCLTIVMPFSQEELNSYSVQWHIDDMTMNHVYMVLAMDIMLVFILVFAFTRTDVIGTARGSPSALYEYSIIFFVLCFYYGHESKICTRITTVVLLLFVAQNFIYGGRITGIQLLILLYIMLLSEYIPLKRLFPFVIVGFIGLNLIGAVRGAWTESGISLEALFSSMWSKKFTLDTAYSSYHTSMTFLLMEDRITMSERLRIFYNFVISIFKGGYGTKKNSIAHYTAQYYAHYNGGILPYFFQFYFGKIGIVLISGAIALWVRICNHVSEESGVLKCLTVYFVVTCFRWYLYSPIQLTRGVLLMAVSYGVAELIQYVMAGGGRLENKEYYLYTVQKNSCVSATFPVWGGAIA